MHRISFVGRWVLAAVLCLSAHLLATAQDAKVAGQRVFVTGHSFHAWIGAPLNDVALAAGIKDHKDAGRQMIGGSRVIQHWDLSDDKNTAKKALRAAGVDVLTMSPHIKMPDDGIDKFTDLLLEFNPKGRVYIQASWYPWDVPGKTDKTLKNADRNVAKVSDLREGYKPFYESLVKQVNAINARWEPKAKRPVAYLVPVGHAVYSLREAVADGTIPNVKQSDLFIDPIGHPTAPIAALAAYCYYAAIYGRSPAGLPVPKILAEAKVPAWNDALNAKLQAIAWDTVTADPLSGVKKDAAERK